MTKNGETDRVQFAKWIRKIFITILTGGLAYFITDLIGSEQPQVWVITVTVLIGGITFIVQFMSDFEHRLESVEEKQKIHLAEMRSLVKDGFAKTSDATALFQAVEASALRTDTVTQLVRYSTQITPNSPPLVYGFAQSQINRMSQFLKELGEGEEVCHDGEDRDWILGLTMQSQDTIEATSLSTVDAGGSGFHGGLWTSDFGQRYLQLQRDAMHRGVVIRRVFVFDTPGQTRESDFLRIYRQQRDLGIHARVLDQSAIPYALKSLLYDFIVFDGVISYEVTPASRVEDTMKPTIVKTNLTLQPERVKERMRRFEELWAAAQELK